MQALVAFLAVVVAAIAEASIIVALAVAGCCWVAVVYCPSRPRRSYPQSSA